MKTNGKTKFSWMGYLILFVTVLFSVALSVAIGWLAYYKTANLAVAIVSTLVTVAFVALNYATIDTFRRKALEKSVNNILQATQSVVQGDFGVRLSPSGKRGQQELDEIAVNLNDMIAELDKQEMFKKDFVANLSHEIKTPLSVLQNYATVLQTDALTKEQRAEYLQTIGLTCKKLTTLVNNILKLSKLENQQIIPQEKQDVTGIVADCLDNLEQQIEQKQLQINCNVQQIKATAPQGVVEIVVNNLLSNAVKFTPQNGTIDISLSRTPMGVVFCVADTGCGMDEETGKCIFDKFFQGDTSHANQGNGLGLALVKKVVDYVGGTIDVNSQLGKGSTFTITLEI